MNAKEIIAFYLENDVLISPELLEALGEEDLPIDSEFIVLNTDVLQINKAKTAINIADYELSVMLKEKYKNPRLYQKFQEYIYQKKHAEGTPLEKKIFEEKKTGEAKHDASQEINSGSSPDNGSVVRPEKITASHPDMPETNAQQPMTASEQESLAAFRKAFLEKHRARLVFNYSERSKKRSVADFVGYFNSRFKEIEKILRMRQELQGVTSISRILSKKEKEQEQVSLIGTVYDKSVTKNGNTMLTLEDTTGSVKVVVSKNKEDLNELVQEIQLDEIIGVTGTYDGIVFANNLLLPDIPLTKELKKTQEEGYIVVISDPQIGNKLFLEKEFERFITWINGEAGNEQQKDIASKIKYLFIVGDLVDGVGIYPDQEYDLKIIDVKDQYEAIAKYIRTMPKIPIFVCPGNHDVGRISEPQPGFNDEYSSSLWSIPNVIPVSNPSLINLFSNPETGFEGFDVLLYHGYSFFYYFGHVPSIRQKGGPKRADLVMKYLLQRRHLAPSHASSLYIPDIKKDSLVIDKVPDFFFSGHVHRATVNNYRNITCINASCWVSKSEEQERRGIEPQPARAFIINMQTREVKVMNFLSKEDQAAEGVQDD